ncbi:MAG TPA: hypothetical protein VHY31_15650 [Streptosporangiaceae bacterium]|nr:hypothetical protein [Streptosporangiaceae bacterium]
MINAASWYGQRVASLIPSVLPTAEAGACKYPQSTSCHESPRGTEWFCVYGCTTPGGVYYCSASSPWCIPG